MARTFNGTSDFIQMGGTVRGNDLLGVMAACWVRPAALASEMKVMARWDSGTTSQWVLAIESDGTVVGAVIDTGFTGHGNPTTDTVSVGVWSHIGMICDGSTVRAYVNGVTTGTPASLSGGLNESSVETKPVFIGKSATGAFYHGDVAECVVQLVNTGLSARTVYEEMMVMLAAGVSPWEASQIVQTSELIRYYPLLGDSPEADFAGHDLTTSTLTGTSFIDHPPVSRWRSP